MIKKAVVSFEIKKEAEEFAKNILDKKLADSFKIEEIEEIYRVKGEIDEIPVFKVLLKTDKIKELQEFVSKKYKGKKVYY